MDVAVLGFAVTAIEFELALPTLNDFDIYATHVCDVAITNEIVITAMGANILMPCLKICHNSPSRPECRQAVKVITPHFAARLLNARHHADNPAAAVHNRSAAVAGYDVAVGDVLTLNAAVRVAEVSAAVTERPNVLTLGRSLGEPQRRNGDRFVELDQREIEPQVEPLGRDDDHASPLVAASELTDNRTAATMNAS